MLVWRRSCLTGQALKLVQAQDASYRIVFGSQTPLLLQDLAEATAAAEENESRPAATQTAFAAGASVAPKDQADHEVARFGAIKEKKHSLEAGIALFNR